MDYDFERESIRKSDYEGGFTYVAEKARKEGLLEGITEGELRKAIKTATRLKALGIPIAQIAESTDLSIKEIEKL